MPIHFAIVADQPAFFDSDLHGNQIPESAFEISADLHARLLEGQAQGKRIAADAKGRPKLVKIKTTLADRRAALALAVKREAARRIEAVSPQWRQMNDMRAPSPAGEIRFAQIDAIRDASAQIEDQLQAMKAAQLDAFTPSTSPLWPEID